MSCAGSPCRISNWQFAQASLLSDPGTRPELRLLSAAAQTRIVSVVRIRPDSRKSVRPFKGIICADISEFESDHLSQAVRSPPSPTRQGMDPLLVQGSERRTGIRYSMLVTDLY